MSSEIQIPAPFQPVERVADPVMAAFEESDTEIEVMYCIGIAPWADGGECLVAIGLSTPHGRAWTLVDRRETCWLVLHRSGTAGQAWPIPKHGDVEELVEACCRFLGGNEPVPVGAGKKLS